MAYGLTQSVNLAAASTQYLQAADSVSLSITGNLTLECWIKLATGTAGEVLTKRTSTGNQRSYDLGASSTSLLFGVSSTGGAVTQVSVSTTLTVGTWYHIAVVYTAVAGSADFYVNGVQAGTQQTGLPTSIFDSTSPFAIGTIFDPPQDLIDGRISLARVWSTTRTSGQILANMCSVLGTTTNLAAEWTLNNVLTDNSGNGNTLTNVSSATFVTDTPSTCAVSTTPNFFNVL